MFNQIRNDFTTFVRTTYIYVPTVKFKSKNDFIEPKTMKLTKRPCTANDLNS